jgi:hypothetical protein
MLEAPPTSRVESPREIGQGTGSGPRGAPQERQDEFADRTPPGGGAVFPCKDIGQPPRASFEMPTAELEAPIAQEEEHRLRAAPGPMRSATSATPSDDRSADGVAAAARAELARRKAKAQWDADRNEREWEELFATCADMGWRMLAGWGRRGRSRGAELARELARAEDWERVHELRIPADHLPGEAVPLAWVTAPEGGAATAG